MLTIKSGHEVLPRSGRDMACTSCRDRGRGGADVGALCLSSSGCNPHASQTPDESSGQQDRHKAPTHPLIHPLSLQERGRHIIDLGGQFPKSSDRNGIG